VHVDAVSLDRSGEVLDCPGAATLRDAAGRARAVFDGRILWNINSTSQGGGVVEILHSLVGHLRGAGVDARWTVMGADPAFFDITKRIHNRLHGMASPAPRRGAFDREHYERVLAANVPAIASVIGPRDAVLLHDPQTAGLVPALRRLGVPVVWICHVGVDRPNRVARDAQRFLLPYAREADACVFSRADYVWGGLDRSRVHIIPPAIDPWSPKNVRIEPDEVRSILTAARLVVDPGPHRGHTSVVRQADVVEEAPVPAGAPLVIQVSRWDRMKDPLGVLDGFAEHVVPHHDAHLVLAGPWVTAVTDDPEGGDVQREVRAAWERLPPAARAAIHLASLPMDDEIENALIVNALQRRADVVAQKSLAEGFGLTVAEAMWKERPVVAGRVGGIQDQIVHGESGLLLDDPADLRAFGDAIRQLLRDRGLARRMGSCARLRVAERFLVHRQLDQLVDVLTGLITSV
jgi:trehalose synthase